MTTYERKRNAEIHRILANTKDCGRFGRVAELESHSVNSKRVKVAGVNEFDGYLHIDSKHNNTPYERKTNGGRIEALRGPKAVKFVVYSMHFVQKHKAGKHTEAWEEVREIDPVVIPTDVFLAALDRFGATKSTNGRNPEEAIQVSSKKFFEWLLDWPIPYEPGTVYTMEDFEGLN